MIDTFAIGVPQRKVHLLTKLAETTKRYPLWVFNDTTSLGGIIQPAKRQYTTLN